MIFTQQNMIKPLCRISIILLLSIFSLTLFHSETYQPVSEDHYIHQSKIYTKLLHDFKHKSSLSSVSFSIHKQLKYKTINKTVLLILTNTIFYEPTAIVLLKINTILFFTQPRSPPLIL